MAYNALYTGISGLRSFGEALGVIGDNIANMSTPGFKAGAAQFGTLLGQEIGSAGSQSSVVGNGTQLLAIGTNQSQGALVQSQVDTDMAITGSGYFMATDSTNRTVYTRAGQFTLDNQGRLVDPAGNVIQGYQVGDSGEITATIGPLVLSGDLGAPTATTAVEITANLNATTTATKTFDPADPFATSDYATAVTIYDSLGTAHTAQMFFVKTATANTWEVHLMVPSSEITGGGTDQYTEVSGGTDTISFDGTGALDAEPSFASGGTPLAINWSNGASASSITIDFGSSITGDGGTGLGGTTQYATGNVLLKLTQDGAKVGAPTGFTVSADGTINGQLSNGDTIVLGRLALANFSNPSGLQRVGDNLYIETPQSGSALVGEAGTAGLGTVRNFALEQSNVDLATEFVNMITNQRAFQANSRVISSNSDLLNQLVQII